MARGMMMLLLFAQACSGDDGGSNKGDGGPLTDAGQLTCSDELSLDALAAVEPALLPDDDPPPAEGGTVVAGDYALTAMKVYHPATLFQTTRGRLVLSGGRLEIDMDGPPFEVFTVFTAVPSEREITLTEICHGGGNPRLIPFTASNDHLTLWVPEVVDEVVELRFELRP